MPRQEIERPKIEGQQKAMLGKLAEAPNNSYQDLVSWFDGAWIPNVDPAYVGYQNYVILRNLRYLDKGLEGVHGYTYSNASDPSGKTITHLKGIQLLKPAQTQTSYYLTFSPYDTNIGATGYIRCSLTSIPSSSITFLTSTIDDRPFNDYEDTTVTDKYVSVTAGVTGRFSHAPQGQIFYNDTEKNLNYGGYENRVGAVFLMDVKEDYPNKSADSSIKMLDVTDSAITNDSTDSFNWDETAHGYMLILCPRPCSSLNFYMSSFNAAAATISAYYWDGSAWQAYSIDDTTVSAGKSLAQNGHMEMYLTAGNFRKHAGYDSGIVPRVTEGLYMYPVLLAAGANLDADIYQITANYYWSDAKDIWDGVYRQPVGAFLDNNGVMEDYTLHVNEPSDVNTPIGMILDLLDADDDNIYLGFEEPVAAIKFTMLTDFVNVDDSQIDSVKYWNGSAWTSVGNFLDGTLDDAGDSSFGASGELCWSPPSGEKPRTFNDVIGYWYQIQVDADFSTGDASKASGSEDVVVDVITGIPAIKDLKNFKFAAQYKDRLLLCNAEEANEGNRVDYCATNAPFVWNGLDSSDDGLQSLYFGTETPLTAATPLYNRFGSTIFTSMVLFKSNEIYLLTGDDPEDFRIYPISYTVGCTAWATVANAEVGFAVTEGAERNVVLFMSHAGPMMFDGAVLMPIRGIENYFDPNESECINFDYMDTSVGWYDSTYREYNLQFPSGSATTPDTWLVYDLVRKRWFEKNTGTATFPTATTTLTSDTGNLYNYACLPNRYQVRLEYGTSWDGTGITYKVKTGDFWPTQNFWDQTRIRKFKLICKRIQESHSVSVNYYPDTAESSGIGVQFVDSADNATAFADSSVLGTSWAATVTTTLDLSAASGLERLVTVNADLNRLAWAHAFDFEVTTDDTTKGFQPIGWGIQYQVIRKDNTAT